ncbi:MULTISPECIES: hypothetical protein [unclassified Methylobacterium]|uniref:hypothetical protein n=1 Tax=Methylobacterium TaxID=407 RepID=UPI001FBBCA35|nr:hypothetical protein [Methylobacterium sp. J-067]MCJ2024644.1 hypothetical protein [Methylobacterium sp. J-067]
MKTLLAGAIVVASIASTAPAVAQRIDIGPGGPSIDLRSRGQRERDFQREEYRRDREAERRAYYREERYRDDRRDDRRVYRRGYEY